MYLTVVQDEELTQFRSDVEGHLKDRWNAFVKAGFLFKAHWGKINCITREDVDTKFVWHDFKPFVRETFINKYLRDRVPIK